jgi:hypothetical protein
MAATRAAKAKAASSQVGKSPRSRWNEVARAAAQPVATAGGEEIMPQRRIGLFTGDEIDTARRRLDRLGYLG